MVELQARNAELEHENEQLRGAVRRAICGERLNEKTSCQLARNHEGKHAWLSPTGDQLTQW